MILFTLVLEDVFRSLVWANWEVNINRKKLKHLKYADELQPILTKLEEESEKVGLKMN